MFGKGQDSPVGEKVLVSHTSTQLPPNQRPLFHIKLVLPLGPHSLTIFIHSVADASIMDEGLSLQLGMHRVSLSRPIAVNALEGYLSAFSAFSAF